MSSEFSGQNSAAGVLPNVTRGHGSLEGYLAKRRASIANSLIQPDDRRGRILDVGCGSYPYFLAFTRFKERFGVDRVVDENKSKGNVPGVQLFQFDVDQQDTLPFPDQHFQVVTMLAVFEHIAKNRLTILLNDVRRTLKPGGMLIMTTPTGWTGPILSTLTRLGLVSEIEIGEHKDSYSKKMVMAVLAETKFKTDVIAHSYFELYMNQWVTIRKKS